MCKQMVILFLSSSYEFDFWGFSEAQVVEQPFEAKDVNFPLLPYLQFLCLIYEMKEAFILHY